MPESVREVLSRITEVRPPREAARTAREPIAVRPGSALVRLGTLPKRRSEEVNDEPLFTAAEIHRVREYLKLYADGYAVLCLLGRVALRPDLSQSDIKEIAKLVHETVAMIEPYRPIVDAANRFSAKQAKVESLCRECHNLLNNWEVNLKLDRFVDLLDPKIQEQSAKRPISTLAELCERLVEKN